MKRVIVKGHRIKTIEEARDFLSGLDIGTTDISGWKWKSYDPDDDYGDSNGITYWSSDEALIGWANELKEQ